MKSDLTFEIKDSETIQWKITIDMDIKWFLNIATRVYQSVTGKPLDEQKKLE